MTFGKRISQPSAQAATATLAPDFSATVALTSPEFTERIRLLLADVARIYETVTTIARQIGDGERIKTDQHNGFAPEAFPIDISGISRHFNFLREGKLRHGVLCYVIDGDVLDRKAQLHLLDMTTAIFEFNKLCIRAIEDDALPIVLQSPAARRGIDKGIVMSALYCALLQNLLYQQSVLAGKDGVQVRKLDPNRMKTCRDDWLAKARRDMLAADRFAAHLPELPPAPSIVEVEIGDHPGQVVVNQVYLPAELSAPVMSRMAAAQMRA